MSDGIIIAIISICGGGAFTLVTTIFTRKTEEAKIAVTKNTEEVKAANTALEGMERLLNNYRIEEEKDKQKLVEMELKILELQQRVNELEYKFKNEQAINLALSKELDKLRGDN